MPVFKKGQTESRCTVCGKIKHISNYFIKEHKPNGDIMYRPWCKLCHNSLRLKHKRKWTRKMTGKDFDVVDSVLLRRCTKCKHLKPISSFYKDRVVNGRQLYLYICKECFKIHKKKFDKPKKPKIKTTIIKLKSIPMLLKFAERVCISIEKIMNSINQLEIKLANTKESEDKKIVLFLKKEKIRLENNRKKRELRTIKKRRLIEKKEKEDRRIRREERKEKYNEKNG